MDEQTFLDSLFQSKQESARQLQAMGRPSSHAIREDALRQVQMLQEVRDAWEYNNKQIKGKPMNRKPTKSTDHEAILSSAGGFTAFSFGGYHIRFRAPYSLERYVDVVRWDDGYLVVLAKYSHNADQEEEYIDLKPILDDLYIDSDAFLKPIKSVRIAYA